jgi:hypothetical protein
LSCSGIGCGTKRLISEMAETTWPLRVGIRIVNYSTLRRKCRDGDEWRIEVAAFSATSEILALVILASINFDEADHQAGKSILNV